MKKSKRGSVSQEIKEKNQKKKKKRLTSKIAINKDSA